MELIGEAIEIVKMFDLKTWNANTSGTAGNIDEPVVKVGKVVVLECLCLWKRIILRQNSVVPNLLNLFVFITSQLFSSLLPARLCPPLSSPTLSVSPPLPWKVLSVLLDLLFQFITQHPFTMSHASCQSLWPVWEPATAVQFFTYWTMVRGGMSRRSQPLHGHLLVCLFVRCFLFFCILWQ